MGDRALLFAMRVMGGSRLGALKAAARKAGVTLEEYSSALARGEKRCSACRAFHPRAAFGPDASRYDGLASSCITAVKRRRKRPSATTLLGKALGAGGRGRP